MVVMCDHEQESSKAYLNCRQNDISMMYKLWMCLEDMVFKLGKRNMNVNCSKGLKS